MEDDYCKDVHPFAVMRGPADGSGVDLAPFEEDVNRLAWLNTKMLHLTVSVDACLAGIKRLEDKPQIIGHPRARPVIAEPAVHSKRVTIEPSPPPAMEAHPVRPGFATASAESSNGHAAGDSRAPAGPEEVTREYGFRRGDKVTLRSGSAMGQMGTVIDFPSDNAVQVETTDSDNVSQINTLPPWELEAWKAPSAAPSATPSAAFSPAISALGIERRGTKVSFIEDIEDPPPPATSCPMVDRRTTTCSGWSQPTTPVGGGLGSVSSKKASTFMTAMLSEDHRKHRTQVRLGIADGGGQALAERIDLMNTLQERLPHLFTRDRDNFLHILYNFVEDPDSSAAARRYARAFNLFLIITSVLTCLQTVDPPFFSSDVEAVMFTTFDVIFCLEMLLRFVLSPNWKGYFKCWFNWIDILAASPIIVRATYSGMRTPSYDDRGDSVDRLFLLLIAPILRLLKIIRQFETIHLLNSAFQQSLEALPVLLYIQGMITLTFAAMIYFVEPRDNISSYPQAIWLSIVTMTTVGYGDVTPTSPAGAIIVSALVIGSMLFMAMPLGIIGSAFDEVWTNRDVVLLMSRTRERLVKWGYTAHDIPLMFDMVDQDGDGELELEEFKELITQMKIGLDDKRMIELFSHFDTDDSGSIDSKEFIKNIFPSTYLEDYGHEREAKAEKRRKTLLKEVTALEETGVAYVTARGSVRASVPFSATDGTLDSSSSFTDGALATEPSPDGPRLS